MNFRWCRHVEITLFHLFNVAIAGLVGVGFRLGQDIKHRIGNMGRARYNLHLWPGLPGYSK